MDHEHCHLVIVGDGPAYAELRQELADVPVTFTGYLSGAALAEAYASADLFAFPSFTETFGQVVLEAMASGLPIVGLLSDGVRDLVSQGQTGLLLDSESLSQSAQVQAYQEQLTRLVLDRDLRQRMSQAALAEARRRSWYEAMESLVQGYRDIVEVSQGLLVA
jgi:glycosyltransferase involved in cell wall biosynthesis